LPNERSADAEWLRSGGLYVLLTQAHCGIPILEAARQVIRGGADVVQLREKQASDRQLVKLARELRRITGNAGVGFMVNDRPDVARLSGADGVHLGQTDMPVAAARKALAAGQIVGVSTHSIADVKRAVADGADYIGVGPIFPTATKGYETGVGVKHLREAATAAQAPLVAIGGITAARVPEVLAAVPGRRVMVAVCSAVLASADIEAAAAAFKKAITDFETTDGRK
jgi:thiamine-phosphate pyrophosphorylase